MSNLVSTEGQGSGVIVQRSSKRMLRVLSFMEATTLTGPAKNLIEFAQAARQAEVNPATITIATFERGVPSKPNAFIDKCTKAGIEVRVIRERFLFDPKVISAIRELVDDFNPDIVQTHHVKSHFLLRLSGRCHSRLWIAFHHGYTQTSLKTQMYNTLDRWSLRSADKLMTVCGPFSRELQAKGIDASRVTVQHNSVRPAPVTTDETKTELRQKMDLPPSASIILSVGRLSREKGHKDALEALAELAKLRPQLDFVFLAVGDGPERSALETLAEKLGISKHAIFAGHQPAPSQYYQLSDIMLLPSHSEGSPNVLLEAMSFGLPTVATRVGGVPEIAEDGRTAILVPRSDTKAMASAIAELLDDREKRNRIGDAAREAATKYTPEAYTQSLLSMYRDSLKNYEAAHNREHCEVSTSLAGAKEKNRT